MVMTGRNFGDLQRGAPPMAMSKKPMMQSAPPKKAKAKKKMKGSKKAC